MQVESPSKFSSFDETVAVAKQFVAPQNCLRNAASMSSNAMVLSKPKLLSSNNCTKHISSVEKQSAAAKNVPGFELPLLPNKVRVRIILSGSIVVPLQSKSTKPNASRPKLSTKRSARPPALLEYVTKGILIPGTGVLSARGMENEVAADLTTDGNIIFNGVTYKYPSSFARVPQRKPKCNGWVNTMYAQPDTPWRSLEDIRSEATKKGAVAGKICWQSTISAPPKKVVSGARCQKSTTRSSKISAPAPPKKAVSEACCQKKTTRLNKISAPVSASSRAMAEIRRCWRPRIQLTARQPEFNWQFYEIERCRLFANASPPLQRKNSKSTSSPTKAPEGGASAAAAVKQIPKVNKSTTNKCKRRKYTARKSSSYYTAPYYKIVYV